MSASPSDSPDLGELFHTAFRGLRRLWAEQLAPYGLTPHQWRALHAVVGHADDAGAAPGVRLKDLAAALRIAPRSATEVVDLLEAQDLVRRRPDPVDRRAVLVDVTQKGARLHAAVRESRRTSSDEYFSRLDAADRRELARLLAGLRSASDDQAPA
ncbi:MarR family winged helix-turn-helix transcriptional regulator [Zafaria sp. Z1313]|uniref:MarR family winged helix-turn-helix transcriptional regulator n=1 Tax=unclassified Zafaria TaxID=2828765 RepID=UPI002E7A261F|nr:MarR family winged helix-turn-helix transcriptional regulator [Zafaria sp. J156]MEE1622504.1 MarR family winged helix-turn-helix transcriptional regulator [Zafaria sp. J156]